MRLFLNKLKNVLPVLAVIASMLCGMLTVTAGAIKGFGEPLIYSFCNETQSTYSSPSGAAVASGALPWKLYDSGESILNKDGLYIENGYLQLKSGNPLNALSDFRLEITYSSSADGEADGVKPFVVTSAKKYTLNQLMTDSATVLGIAENGDVYYKGQKINHADGAKAADILTSKNPQINAGDECKLTVKYVDGKLTVTLTYNKTSVKLVENYQCVISGLQQFILGGDKSNRLDKMIYKSIAVSAYGEYEPQTEGVRAVLQVGETVKEYDNAETALNDALKQAESGNSPTLKFYSDITLKKSIKIPAGKALTVDLNGHTINRNCHSTVSSEGCVFLVNAGASLKIEDSSPDAQNYSTAIRGGVIMGGAGDDCGGGIHMDENSRLTMTGGSVVGCITNDHGGAIRVSGRGVKISISGAGFYSNMTLDSADNSHGGAIYSDYSDCEVTVKDSVFEGNYSEDCGGAIYINDGRFTSSDCIFNSNKCLDDGGAVYIERNAVTSFDRCTFVNNRSDGQGGAAYCNSSDGARFSGTFRNNSAGKAGGALFINGDRVSIQDAVITDNTTGDRGGAMYVDEMYDINIQGKLIVKNNYKQDKSRDDIFLDSIGVATARVYDGGLYEGSEVWVLTSGSNQTVCENISAYQQKFFRSDDSSKKLQFTSDSSKTQKQSLITSAIGNGNVRFIVIASAAVILAAVIMIIIRNKKKGADKK